LTYSTWLWARIKDPEITPEELREMGVDAAEYTSNKYVSASYSASDLDSFEGNREVTGYSCHKGLLKSDAGNAETRDALSH